MPRITDEDKVYVACILDNFGGFSIRTLDNGTKQPYVHMFGKRENILRWLGEITGTTAIVVTKMSSRHVCTEHCTEAHPPQEYKSMRWQVTGMKATILLHNALPHMRQRAEEAAKVLAVGLQAPYKEAYVEQMADIGWEIPNIDPANGS